MKCLAAVSALLLANFAFACGGSTPPPQSPADAEQEAAESSEAEAEDEELDGYDDDEDGYGGGEDDE